MEYRDIHNEQDAAVFIAETNGLHDGCIISVDYKHDGYTWGNPMYVDTEKTRLVLQIMVTSIHDTLVELTFEGVQKLQITGINRELLDSSISFSQDGLVIWCDDNSTTPETLYESNYVIAKTMKWQIIDN